MNAREFVDLYGDRLIGKAVNTDPVGGYIGGVAVIKRLHPDPAAPEIVATVSHPYWKHNHSKSCEIGIFEHEELSFAVI